MNGAVFDGYAAYYDLLYRGKDYAAEVAYVASLLQARARGVTRILELGCGTGAHAEHLARMGFTVHGVDLSAEMLLRANKRKASLPLEVAQRLSFAQGDVRTARVVGDFDAVISLFHVFSYQISNEDVEAAFATAAMHLKPGGLLCFDYWYGPAVLSERPSVRVRRMQDTEAKVLRIAEPEIDTSANQVVVNYSIVVEDLAAGRIHQFSERHPMRYFFLPELEKFGQTAFRNPQHFAWMQDARPSERDWAAVSILERQS